MHKHYATHLHFGVFAFRPQTFRARTRCPASGPNTKMGCVVFGIRRCVPGPTRRQPSMSFRSKGVNILLSMVMADRAYLFESSNWYRRGGPQRAAKPKDGKGKVMAIRILWFRVSPDTQQLIDDAKRFLATQRFVFKNKMRGW